MKTSYKPYNIDLYSQQISEEQKLIHELESKTKELEEHINKERKNMGG